MNMLFKLWLLWQSPRLGSDAFYPLPDFLKKYLAKFHLHERVIKYARVLVGADLSYIAPDMYGCCESVTRLLRSLNPDITPLLTYTPDFKKHMDNSSYFIEIPERLAQMIGGGVIGIAPTVEGVQVGHVWIQDYDGRVLENNSYGKDWGKYRSNLEIKKYYKKLDIHYYLPI